MGVSHLGGSVLDRRMRPKFGKRDSGISLPFRKSSSVREMYKRVCSNVLLSKLRPLYSNLSNVYERTHTTGIFPIRSKCLFGQRSTLFVALTFGTGQIDSGPPLLFSRVLESRFVTITPTSIQKEEKRAVMLHIWPLFGKRMREELRPCLYSRTT